MTAATDHLELLYPMTRMWVHPLTTSMQPKLSYLLWSHPDMATTAHFSMCRYTYSNSRTRRTILKVLTQSNQTGCLYHLLTLPRSIVCMSVGVWRKMEGRRERIVQGIKTTDESQLPT